MTTTTITVQEAERQLAAATATVDRLKAKILDQGAGAVTAEELGEAALAVEHARLVIGHAAQAAEAAAQRQRLERLDKQAADIIAKAGNSDTARKAMQKIEEGVAELLPACEGRPIAQWIRDMVAEGVPAYDPHGKQRTNANGHTHGPSTQLTDEHARLGWSDASMSGGIAVHVDGRKIAKIHPGLLVAAAIVRGARQAHYGAGFLGPLVKIDGPQQDLVNDPDGWLRARF